MRSWKFVRVREAKGQKLNEKSSVVINTTISQY